MLFFLAESLAKRKGGRMGRKKGQGGIGKEKSNVSDDIPWVAAKVFMRVNYHSDHSLPSCGIKCSRSVFTGVISSVISSFHSPLG